jgi:hypothetical protein
MSNSAWLIFGAIILIPIFIAVFTSICIFRRKRRGRRTPLTSNLLRGPGESLRTEIERITEQLDNTFINLFTSCVPPLMVVLLLGYLQNNIVPIWQLILTYLFFLLLVAWATRRIYLLLKQRANLYLGLDAELAVGQELNHLMAQGCRVFHDFPAENFNIDHMVVGPGGVFAVETKGRAKPDKGRGSVDATVVYDGQILRFPDWHEKEPLAQAKRQSEWLQKWLSSAVGETTPVKPALALPGWFIERTKSGNVLLFNGKSPQFLARPQSSAAAISLEMIQRIAHQLEQRCRDVEPTAYRKKK